MFDNILYQPTLVNILTREISNKLLPQSMLFVGTPFSGKMTSAIEVGRALMCTESADWGCQCRNCQLHRQLEHTSMLILGQGDFLPEIQSALDVYSRFDKVFSKFVVRRAIRKLTIRFHPLLWEGEEAKMKKFRNLLSSVEDYLDQFALEAPRLNDKDLEKTKKGLLEDCQKLSGFVPKSIPVDQIRRIAAWSHQSSNNPKVVIIDKAEQMQDSARNALLKILEEPPHNVFFLLITNQRGSILPTLLSRLRIYNFPERTIEQQKDILMRIFREDSGEYESIKEYFYAWKGLAPGTMKAYALEFRDAIKNDIVDYQLPDLAGRDYFRIFLEELVKTFRQDLHNTADVDFLGFERTLNIVKDSLFSVETLNQNPSLALERLFFNLKEGK
ncbi:DNA polymerase III subunit delta' [Spirochaeta cellobiosiphila]|uniref:DNA polymerase III subunit delta' n=1 Tax=Spirochaeta cellobiosiphila TaxID=504483 RepID=UPI0004202433|nr:AAA family ATPase [Spirochaeta cellobiosiphila]